MASKWRTVKSFRTNLVLLALNKTVCIGEATKLLRSSATLLLELEGLTNCI